MEFRMAHPLESLLGGAVVAKDAVDCRILSERSWRQVASVSMSVGEAIGGRGRADGVVVEVLSLTNAGEEVAFFDEAASSDG